MTPRGERCPLVLTVRGSLLLKGSLPRSLSGRISQRLSVPNPAYLRAVRGGRRPYGLPSVVRFYGRIPGGMELPRGFLQELLAMLKEEGIAASVVDERMEGKDVTFPPLGMSLRSYQQEALEQALAAGEGILEAPTGSGKTVMGLALLANLGRSALWITHTRDLLVQTAQRAQEILGLEDGEIGRIGDGQDCVGERLTVALVQSLVRRDMEDLAPHFGTVLVDECHHVPSQTFTEVLSALPARYRYGLTATPERADGLGDLMYLTLGAAAARVDQKHLVAGGQVLIPRLFWLMTDVRLPFDGDFNRLLTDLLADAGRNRRIIRVVAELASRGRFVLVLSRRVEHVRTLGELLQQHAPDVPGAVLTGDLPRSERQLLLAEAAEGKRRVLFATSLADEGLDLPRLDALVLTSPARAAGKIRQQLGRIMRPHPGKPIPVLVDVVDKEVPVLRAQARQRWHQVYRPLGMEGHRTAEEVMDGRGGRGTEG